MTKLMELPVTEDSFKKLQPLIIVYVVQIN